MLDDFDRPDLYLPLLDLINPTNLSATDVTGLIEFLVDLFDATLPVPKAGFPFAGDFPQPVASARSTTPSALSHQGIPGTRSTGSVLPHPAVS